MKRGHARASSGILGLPGVTLRFEEMHQAEARAALLLQRDQDEAKKTRSRHVAGALSSYPLQPLSQNGETWRGDRTLRSEGPFISGWN